MLLPLYALSSKIAIKKNLVYSQVSRDFAKFPVFKIVTLGWKSVDVWWAVTSRHTTHYRSKMVKSSFFVLVFVLSYFKDIIRFKKYFSVYPAAKVNSPSESGKI